MEEQEHMFVSVASAVEEVCCHEQLEGNLWGNGELGDLGGAVCVAHLVCEVLAHLL